MVEYDLDSLDIESRFDMINMCYNTFGPANETKWKLHHLRFIQFADEKYLTLILLKCNLITYEPQLSPAAIDSREPRIC